MGVKELKLELELEQRALRPSAAWKELEGDWSPQVATATSCMSEVHSFFQVASGKSHARPVCGVFNL